MRNVSQRSSTATTGVEPCELNLVIGPGVKTTNLRCESWLSSYGARSNSVSQRGGWRDSDVAIEKSYSSVR